MTSAVLMDTQVVKSLWPDSSPEVFGSYATQLYLPSSDVDMVVLDTGCGDVVECLKQLGRALVQQKVAEDVQVHPMFHSLCSEYLYRLCA